MRRWVGWAALSVACSHVDAPTETVQAMPSRRVRARLLPDVKVEPARPDQGLDPDSRGYVVVEYDVDADGRIVDPRVVFAHPRGLFDAIALDKIRAMVFDPLPARRRGLRTKLAFFTDASGHPTVGAAFVVCRGLPYVVVEFDVRRDGVPADPKVIEACPDGVYEAIALRMVQQRRFPPTARPRRGLRTRLTFGTTP